MVGMVFIGYAIWRYQLFRLTPRYIANELVATLSDPLMLVDTGGNIASANAAIFDLTGYDRSEMIGKPLDRFVSSRTGATPISQLVDIQNLTDISQIDAVLETKSNDWVPVSVSLSPLKNQDGDFRGIIYNVRNESERVRSKREIAALQRENELILSSAGEGIIGMGTDGSVIFVNPAVSTITGWSTDELIGKDHHSVLHHSRSNGEA